MKNIILVLIVLLSACFLFSNDILTIGTDQNEGALFYPQIIKEGPGGIIYISDRKDYFIKAYSPSGQYLKRIGGKGEGPGQMKRMGSFGIDEDKNLLYFSEFFGGHSWITNMKLNGKFDSLVNLKIKRRFGLRQIIKLPENNFITEINYSGEIKKKGDYFEYRYPMAVIVLNMGTIRGEIVKKNYIYSVSMIGDGADLTIPFIPKFFWVKLKSSIIFADGLDKKLKIIDFKGKNIGEILTPLPLPEKVTDVDLEKWRKKRKESYMRRNRTWYHRFGKVIDKYKKSVHEFKPNISEMSLTYDGNILIGGVSDSIDVKTNFWLLKPNGKVINSFSAKVRDITITKSYVLFKSYDEDENTIVNCIYRKGTEKEDLLRSLSNK